MSITDDAEANEVDDRVLDAVKQFMSSLDGGQSPSVQNTLREHADIADELQPALEGLLLVHGASKEPRPSAANECTQSLNDTLGGQPIGDFRIIREIGRGGMGVVYEATQISLNRRVALKVLPMASGLDEVRLQRFRNEANAAATLHHTNIVPVHAVGSDRGVHFYAMQLIDGITLSNLLKDLRAEEKKEAAFADTMDAAAQPTDLQGSAPEAQVNVSRAKANSLKAECSTASRYTTQYNTYAERRSYYRNVVRMIHQAALAIEHAHRYGIVHRDIKPANLLLEPSGKVWVADFGLAQVQAEQSNLTQTGDPMGTLRYTSPEQATGRRGELDHRTDFYALGATRYELLTLKPIVEEGTFHQILTVLTETQRQKWTSLVGEPAPW
ncbi:MAG: serine/threonine-protein kinase [Planctomycetota bacterium]